VYNFAERLKDLRTEKGVGHVQLAEAIGVAKSNISFWERGITDIKGEYIVRLAKFFNVTCGQLLGTEDL